MNHYAKGALVRVRGTWKRENGQLVDPDSGSLVFKLRIGTVAPVVSYTYPTDGQIVRVSRGVYYIDVSADTDDADYFYRWESTGSVQAAKEGVFHVDETAFD